MTERQARRWGIALFASVVGLQVWTLGLAPGIAGSPGLTNPFRLEPSYFVVMGAQALASLLLVWARPRNSVGWLLGLSAFLGALCEWGQVFGAHALVVEGSRLPLGALVLSWSAPLWLASLLTPATLLLARYPTGRLSEGRWHRRVDRAVMVGMVFLWIGYAGGLASVTDEVATAVPPVLLPQALGAVFGLGAALLLLPSVLFVAVTTVRRMLRSAWPERPQIALLVTATSLSVLLVMFGPWELLGSAAFALLPLSVAVGVLRYRLLGIEVVIRRTLLYGALTGLVLLVFVAVTAGFTSLLPDGPAPQVLAAAIVAVVLVPARDRLQRLVDRLLYGDRAVPWEAFSRLGREAADGSALDEVVAAVAQALRVPGVEVRGADGTTVVWGRPSEDAREVPLVVEDQVVGHLRLSPRYGERVLGAADDRLLEALAPLIALVLRGMVLTAALRRERERVVQATEAERARLRRDLHDGLGPSLTGIGLGLEAVAGSGLTDRSRAIVARVRAEVGASLEEVRRIIDDLRPGALESSDLLGLLRARAQYLTSTSPLRMSVEAPATLPPLSPDVEAAALRILEEAVTNVVRHAQATCCTVTVSLDPVSDGLLLRVEDDGVGFLGPREDGVGLDSMRARAAALGGRLDLTGSEHGSVLVAELPLGVAV